MGIRNEIHCLSEIAWEKGLSIFFLSKPRTAKQAQQLSEGKVIVTSAYK
jgi:hypothetical protein